MFGKLIYPLANRALIRLARAASALLFAASTLPALAAIPAAERQGLVDLYNSTHGTEWANHDDWMGEIGTECTWAGVGCDVDQTHVVSVDLHENRLGGSLPDSLNQLKALQRFSANFNQLTGSIPSLNGLTALQSFSVSFNQLTGSIPVLDGLTALQTFSVFHNELTGSIPALSGLRALKYFYAFDNQLTGNIPTLNGLTALEHFYADRNQLTGSIPALNGLTALESFDASGNQLTGTPPAAPGGLEKYSSALCPNHLSTPSPTDAAWDAATGGTWSTDCTAAP